VNTNNGVKWRRFIVPKKVEQINDHLFRPGVVLGESLTVHRCVIVYCNAAPIIVETMAALGYSQAHC